MTPFDDPSNPHAPNEPAAKPPSGPSEDSPQESSPEPETPADDLASRIVVHSAHSTESLPQLSVHIDELPQATAPPPPTFASYLPEDLRITWSWLHLFIFAVFAVGSIIVIQLGIVLYYAAGRQLTQKQMEEIFQSNPQLAVGSNIAWFFIIFLFLYMTLAVLRERPFWPTLGWHKLRQGLGVPATPWAYFFGGVGLAICVGLAGSRLKTPEHMPIEDLFKNRTGAMLLMGMAVFVAPLVEETVFRGYLYPLFASSFSRLAGKVSTEPEAAIRTGTMFGVILTGTLFGLLHGAQLGWTWGLVLMLITVGIIFTYTRAKTGTVLASFLMHLGYNSMIAVSAILSTHGFTRMPPHP